MKEGIFSFSHTHTHTHTHTIYILLSNLHIDLCVILCFVVTSTVERSLGAEPLINHTHCSVNKKRNKQAISLSRH